jgi:transposase
MLRQKSLSGTTPGRSQMPRPLPREKQYQEPPSETIEEPEESGESKEESSSEDELPPDIPEQC